MIAPDELARRDRIAFTKGDCHVLARAIQLRTGWPIYSLHDGSETPNYHAFVVMPDGRALDVLGVRTVDEMLRWAQAIAPHVRMRGCVATDWPTLRRSWGATVLSTYAPKRARRVAAELLAGLACDESGRA